MNKIKLFIFALAVSLSLIGGSSPASAHSGMYDQVKQYNCTWPCGWANIEGTVRWNSTHDITRVQVDLVGGGGWVNDTNALYDVRAKIYRGNGTLFWESPLRSFDKSELPGIFIPPSYSSNGGRAVLTGKISFEGAGDKSFSFTLPVE